MVRWEYVLSPCSPWVSPKEDKSVALFFKEAIVLWVVFDFRQVTALKHLKAVSFELHELDDNIRAPCLGSALSHIW